MNDEATRAVTCSPRRVVKYTAASAWPPSTDEPAISRSPSNSLLLSIGLSKRMTNQLRKLSGTPPLLRVVYPTTVRLSGMTLTCDPRSKASITTPDSSDSGKVKRSTAARSVGAISATTSWSAR